MIIIGQFLVLLSGLSFRYDHIHLNRVVPIHDGVTI